MTLRAPRTAPRTIARHPLSLAVAAAMLAAPAMPALAQSATMELPRGGNVVGGGANATISYNPGRNTDIAPNSSTTINQGARGAIIDWGSFSISNGNTVNFTYTTPGGVTLNRVVGWGNGPDPSLIQGAINAPDGTVFLVNPAGITFAGSARVNVGGIVASTLAIDNASFEAGVGSGRFTFAQLLTGSAPEGINVEQGATITATRADGTIALLGGSVANDGTLTAAGGSIGLVAGSSVTLDPYGDGLTQFTLNAPADNGAVTSSGSVTSDGGSIDLRSDDQVDITGTLRARSVGDRHGRITADAGDGMLTIGGLRGLRPALIDATGAGPGEAGGEVHLRGHDIGIQAGSVVDASSLDGDGGYIDVRAGNGGNGGDGANATASSDAGDGGDGGNGGSIRLAGTLRANGGNGGLIALTAGNGGNGGRGGNGANGLTYDYNATTVTGVDGGTGGDGGNGGQVLLDVDSLISATATADSGRGGIVRLVGGAAGNGGRGGDGGGGVRGPAPGPVVNLVPAPGDGQTALGGPGGAGGDGGTSGRVDVEPSAQVLASASGIGAGGGEISLSGGARGRGGQGGNGGDVPDQAGAIGRGGNGGAGGDGGGGAGVSTYGTLAVDATGAGGHGGSIDVQDFGTGFGGLGGTAGRSRGAGAATRGEDGFDELPYVIVGGTLSASASGQGGTGGSLLIRSASVWIRGEGDAPPNRCGGADARCALLDASGEAGGGNATISATHDILLGSGSRAAAFAPGPNDTVVVRADALSSGRGGNVDIHSQGMRWDDGATGNVNVNGRVVLSADGLGRAAGGTLQVRNDNGSIYFDGEDQAPGAAQLSADGAAAGGSVLVDAADELLFGARPVDDPFRLSADARDGGGSGGTVTTRATLLDLRGLDVSASGSGSAGLWQVESGNDLALVHGSDDFGSFTSLVSDASVQDALSSGSSVGLQAGVAGGDIRQINIAPGVDIAAGNALPVTLSFRTPAGQVLGGVADDGDTLGAWSIGGGDAPLNLVFDARSTIGLYSGALETSGGLVSMTSQASSTEGINLNGTTIATGGGDVDLDGGIAQGGDGVVVYNSKIATDGGDLDITGASSATDGDYRRGVAVDSSSIDLGSGGLRVNGHSDDDSGVQITSSTITTSGAATITGSGHDSSIDLYGSTLRTGALELIGNDAGMYVSNSTLDADNILSLSTTRGEYANIFVSANSSLHGATLAIDSHAGVGIWNSGLVADGDAAIHGATRGEGASVDIVGSTAQVGGKLAVDGEDGVYVSDSTVTVAGEMELGGRSNAGTALSLWDSSFTVGGDARLLGIGDGTIGIHANGITLASNGLQATGSGRAGVWLSSSTLDGGNGTTGVAGIANGPVSMDVPPVGVLLEGATQLRNGSGGLSVSGWSQAGHGIRVEGQSSIAGGDETVILRAGSGAGTALQVDGTVSSRQLVNLRAGMAQGEDVIDDTTAVMELGGAFASSATLSRLLAPTLVVGHAGHAGAITVAGALARDGNLTLQNDGGAGGIRLNGAIDLGDGTLALSSGGDIAQASGAAITAHSLLVRADGNATLDATANHLANDTLAADVAGDFSYLDAGPLSIGTVSASGIGADGAAGTLSATGIGTGGNVLVRNLAGNLTLHGGVSGNRIDLVTAGVLDNAGNAMVTATDSWRMWASTWAGEQRGGLAGSGPAPNFYDCSFAGTCGVTVAATGNHFIYAVQPTLTIGIDDQSREYGLANPALTYTVSGLVLADDRLDQALAGSTSTGATAASNVGNYAIDGDFTAANLGYAVATVLPGTLAVTPANLVVSAGDASKTYGDAAALDDYSVVGLRNSDTVTGVTLASDGTAATANVGRYAIDASNAAGTGLSNYTIDYRDGALTVDPASLTIAAGDASKTYGDATTLDDYSVVGLRNSDTVTGVTLASDGTAATANVGRYAIDASNANGTGLSNYAIDYRDAVLTVDPASLTIAAGNASKTYGQTALLGDYTVDGLRNGDTVTGVSLASDGAATTANVGRYAIDASNANGTGLSNYDIDYLAGALAVDPATLTYVADPLSILMGQRIGTLNGTVTGFANGETLADATTGTLSFTTDATSTSLPGEYAILGGGLSAGNYVFEQAPANYTVLNIATAAVPTPIDFVLQRPDNYVYDLNIGQAASCPVETPQGMKQESDGDTLGRDWVRVRTRPNLMNCLSSERENGCGDF